MSFICWPRSYMAGDDTSASSAALSLATRGSTGAAGRRLGRGRRGRPLRLRQGHQGHDHHDGGGGSERFRLHAADYARARGAVRDIVIGPDDSLEPAGQDVHTERRRDGAHAPAGGVPDPGRRQDADVEPVARLRRGDGRDGLRTRAHARLPHGAGGRPGDGVHGTGNVESAARHGHGGRGGAGRGGGRVESRSLGTPG